MSVIVALCYIVIISVQYTGHYIGQYAGHYTLVNTLVTTLITTLGTKHWSPRWALNTVRYNNHHTVFPNTPFSEVAVCNGTANVYIMGACVIGNTHSSETHLYSFLKSTCKKTIKIYICLSSKYHV